MRQTCLALRDVFVSASNCDLSAAIVCVRLCLHGCKSVLLHLIQSMVWFIADGCLLPKECDSWKKLKLRMVDKLEVGRKKPGMWLPSNHPLSRGSIHPHPSLLLGVWHRYKMSPGLICRAVHTLHRFILKLAVKQNQLFCLCVVKYDWRPLKYVLRAVCTSVDLLVPPFLPFLPLMRSIFLTVKFTSSSDVLYNFFIGYLNRKPLGLLSPCRSS